MTFDAALAIRVASAGLFVLLGLAIIGVGRKSWRAACFGTLLAMWGLQIVGNNLARSLGWEMFIGRGVQGMLTAAVAVAASFFPLVVRRTARASWCAVAIALVIDALLLVGRNLDRFDTLLGYTGAPPSVLPFLHISGPTVGVASVVFTLAISFGVAFSPPDNPKAWRNAVAMACTLGVWGVLQVATLTQEPLDPRNFLAELLLVVALSGAWLVAAARGGGHLARRMAILWPLVGLLAYLYLLVPGAGISAFYDPWGLLGVARLVGWGILVHAIVKDDLLGVPLPHIVVRRGAVAGTALATLFIVAQIAQNFFSAEYGLLTGGIVAGTFLFAASPLQRAMERLGEVRPTASRARGKTGATSHQENAFRDAVRLAWRDRRFDQGEEVTLANLADSMGLTAKRATEIRHEVEREKGAV